MFEAISPGYRQQLAQLHAERPDFGARGHRWAGEARKWANKFEAETFLDYGCGKATLGNSCEYFAGVAWLNGNRNWQNYDPAIPEFSAPPRPADLVMCLDVLEHIEPDHIDAVLDDLHRLTLKACVMFVDTGPAHKTLPDGRNAHILQRPIGWWLPKMMERFTLHTVLNERPEFLFIGIP